MGDELKQLLAIGAKSALANGYRQGQGKDLTKRARVPCMYELIREHSFRNETELRAFACTEARAGRGALAEFCTKHGHKLKELLQNAWAVSGAPQAMLDSQLTLLEKLQAAAETLPCLCNDRWIPGAKLILRNNGYSAAMFAAAVRLALQLGAKRGANVALTGVGGCGKSALLEPLQQLYRTMSKPQAGSTFPFLHAVDAEIILWQDYAHCEKTLRFTDLLSVFVGETVAIRVPGAANMDHKNAAPAFYSGRTPMWPTHIRDQEAHAELRRMMDERFQHFHFATPLPQGQRDTNWIHCAKCCAIFYLTHHAPEDCQSAPEAGAASRSSAGSNLVAQLRELAELKAQGVLDEDEFRLAKRRLLEK